MKQIIHTYKSSSVLSIFKDYVQKAAKRQKRDDDDDGDGDGNGGHGRLGGGASACPTCY